MQIVDRRLASWRLESYECFTLEDGQKRARLQSEDVKSSLEHVASPCRAPSWHGAVSTWVICREEPAILRCDMGRSATRVRVRGSEPCHAKDPDVSCVVEMQCNTMNWMKKCQSRVGGDTS